MRSAGYAVTYPGLQLEFVDHGVDLVLVQDGETLDVQCKYVPGPPLNLGRIRWLMYKADAFLAKQYQGHPLHFHLVVADRVQWLSSAKLRINGLLKKHSTAARHFEKRFKFQNRVRLKIVEVPMPCPIAAATHWRVNRLNESVKTASRGRPT